MSSDNALWLDAICKRYGILPSDYLGIKNKVVAMDVDIAIATKGSMAEHTSMSMPVDDDNKLPAEKASPSKTKQQMANLEMLVNKADSVRGKK